MSGINLAVLSVLENSGLPIVRSQIENSKNRCQLDQNRTVYGTLGSSMTTGRGKRSGTKLGFCGAFCFLLSWDFWG